MRLLYFVKIITFKILFPTGKVMFLIFFIYKRDIKETRIACGSLTASFVCAPALPVPLPYAMIYV